MQARWRTLPQAHTYVARLAPLARAADGLNHIAKSIRWLCPGMPPGKVFNHACVVDSKCIVTVRSYIWQLSYPLEEVFKLEQLAIGKTGSGSRQLDDAVQPSDAQGRLVLSQPFSALGKNRLVTALSMRRCDPTRHHVCMFGC